MIIAFDPVKPLSDFRNFLTLIWLHLDLPKPTRRQYAIAKFLQYGHRRQMVEAFRGVGKSWITAAFVLFCLYNNPALNILVVSASKAKADEFSTFCMRLIKDMPELRHMAPREGQRDSKIMFDVAGAPPSQSASVKSVGITGQITGSRADLIVPDDIEVPSNSGTQMQREKLAESIKEFDAVLKPDGHVCFLGTPQNESSIYKRLPPRGYTVKVWPARYPTAAQIITYGDSLAEDVYDDLKAKPTLQGHSTEPTRFSDDDLMEREISYGKAGFALQFMLDTNLSDIDRYPLKLKDLLVMPLTPDVAPERCIWSALSEYALNDLPVVGMDGDRYYRPVPMPGITYLPYTGKIMAVDPSGRGKDETAYAVVGICNGLLYLLDAGGFTDGYSTATLTALADVAKKWKVNTILHEANYGDGMFGQLLKPVVATLWPVAVEEVKHSSQKEKRIIDTLEPVLASHRLIVNQDLIEKDYRSTEEYSGKIDRERIRYYQLFYQMTRLTRDRGSLAQDDRLDALSMAVNFWVESMARSVDKAVEEHRERLRKKDMEVFRKGIFGERAKPSAKTWIDHTLGVRQSV